jgi:hypothetical protein
VIEPPTTDMIPRDPETSIQMFPLDPADDDTPE